MRKEQILSGILLTLCFHGTSSNPVKNSFSPKSPLDATSELPNFWAYGIDPSDAENLPDCALACAEYVLPFITSVLQQNTNQRRIEDACSEFDRAETCVRQLTHCPRNEIYTTLTSGVRYMCVEQRQAFEANVGCMDKVNDKVYSECDATCNPQMLINGFALKDVFTRGFAEGMDFGIVKKYVDPHLTKIFFSESCRIGQCLLQCYRNKFNLHCDGSAGSLLAEAIVRPFDSSDVKSLPLGAFFGAFMPTQCRFLYDGNSLKKFRISPQLDQELKRLYGSGRKVLTTEERVVEAINNFLPASEDPFKHVEQKLGSPIDSPIDAGYQALMRDRRRSSATSSKFRMDDTDASDGTASESAPSNKLAEEQARSPLELPYDSSVDIESSGDSDSTDGKRKHNRRETDDPAFDTLLRDFFDEDLAQESPLDQAGRRTVLGSIEELDAQLDRIEQEGESGEMPSGFWPDEAAHTSSDPAQAGGSGDREEESARQGRTSGEDGRYDDYSGHSGDVWYDVEEVPLPREGSPVVEFGAKPDADGITRLQLQRTVDNADLYLAQWVRPDRTYRVDVNVAPEDEGEFVCLLRTYKAFAVNRLTEEDIEELIAGIEEKNRHIQTNTTL